MKNGIIILLGICFVNLIWAQDCNIINEDFESYGCSDCDLVPISNGGWIKYEAGAADAVIFDWGGQEGKVVDIASIYSQPDGIAPPQVVQVLDIANPGIVDYHMEFYNECGMMYLEFLESFENADSLKSIGSILYDYSEITFDNQKYDYCNTLVNDFIDVDLRLDFSQKLISILCNDSILVSAAFEVDASKLFGIAYGSNQCNYIRKICINNASLLIDNDGDGFLSDEDCDDENAEVNSGMTEIAYNGIDDDCNEATLDDDLDGDGYLLADDCDDNDERVNPAMIELPYNGKDDDCDPMTFDDDLDGDGFLMVDDCDDENAEVNSGMTEIAYNGIDDDCNEATLDDDLDGDGYLLADDCDDENAEVNSGMTEIAYNGVDDDCDPMTLDDDLDGDGFLLAEDCNDEDQNVNPSALEIPNNGIDEDCDGEDLITTTKEELSYLKYDLIPNPASDRLRIEFNDSNKFSVRILDFNGRELVSRTMTSGDVSIHELPSGVYLVAVQMNDASKQVNYKRLVVSK